VNKVDGLFFNGFLSQELTNLLTYHAQGLCQGGESTCQARVRVFPSEHIPILNSSAISHALPSI
jgi:hypothetical protein